MTMHNCAKDILAHHDEAVTLPQAHRSEMRQRRDANRTRLDKGLEKADDPLPIYYRSQGSYAMKTMVQHWARDYDIDDGVYFEKGDLVGPRGGEMSALDARWMVRDAIDDGSFTDPPEVRSNCVRVFYQAGYHVDLPVYRRVVTKDFFGNETEHFELASSSGWTRSDACDVTAWFEGENNDQSPDTTNGRQLRRTVRQIKAFARSRDSWSGRILSGFGITKLVTECYHADTAREDVSLYETMKAMRDRLDGSTEIDHPCTPDQTITDEGDARARFLRDKLSDALTTLAPLFGGGCTRADALKAWDKVFNTTFFSERPAQTNNGGNTSKSSILTSGLLSEAARTLAAQEAVRKDGGGRYA